MLEVTHVAELVDWYYATTRDACHLRTIHSAWDTALSNCLTAPAVKEGLRKVWVGDGGDVVTLDALNGNFVRKVSFGGSVQYVGCHGPNLIVSIDDGRLIAIDPETEATRWSIQVGGAIWFAAETTDILSVRLVSGPTPVFDAFTGAQLWSFPDGFTCESAADGVFYIGNNGHAFEARRAIDGTLIWTHAATAFTFMGAAVVSDMVYTVTFDGNLYSFAATSGDLKWAAKTQAGLAPGALLYATRSPNNDVIMVLLGDSIGSGGIAAYDTSTGSEVWTALPLSDLQPGEQLISPAMRFFTGCLGFPSAGIMSLFDDVGQPIPSFSWNVGALEGLAYLRGPVFAWPNP
jgi:outer membrane protein assembly factor BamB